MHDYLFGVEAVRFAFVFGILVSLVLYERWHLTTGSIVVPGYIGVFILHPLVIVMTFVNAFSSYWLVNRILPRYVLLYGRTKFSVLAMVSIVIQTLMLRVSPSSPWLWESDMPLLVGAGYVVPALIAHDMGRQGRRKTLRSVTIAGLIVSLPLLFALLFLPTVQAERILVNFDVMAIPPEWVPVAVLLSAVAAWAIQHNHRARCGGFIGAAYLAMLAKSTWQIGFLVIVAVVTYVIVTQVLARMTIMFGRRKFASMLLTSCILSWGSLWFGAQILGINDAAYTTLASVALVPLFVPGLLANDMERVGVPRVLIGALLGAGFVYATTTWLSAIGSPIATPLETWIVATVALASGAFIFDAQVISILRYLASRLHRRRPVREVAMADTAVQAPEVDVATSSGAEVLDPDEFWTDWELMELDLQLSRTAAGIDGDPFGVTSVPHEHRDSDSSLDGGKLHGDDLDLDRGTADGDDEYFEFASIGLFEGEMDLDEPFEFADIGLLDVVSDERASSPVGTDVVERAGGDADDEPFELADVER